MNPLIRMRTLRSQIYLTFGLILFLLMVWLACHLYLNQSRNSYKELAESYGVISLKFGNSMSLHRDFLLRGYKDTSFHLTGSSKDLTQLKMIHLGLQKDLNQMVETGALNDDLNKKIKRVSYQITSIDSLLNNLERTYLKRGFKDFGVEGQMRMAAHALQQTDNVDKTSILQLRRHEKDFMLRSDLSYMNNFNGLVDSLELVFKENSKARSLLDKYQTSFNSLVVLENNLHRGNISLNSQIRIKEAQIKDSFASTLLSINQFVSSENKKLNFLQILIAFVIVAITIHLFLKTTRMFIRGVTTLSNDITEFVRSGFKSSENRPYKSNIRELNKLFAAYKLMKKELSLTIAKAHTATQDAQHLATTKSQFLANMSHEIRSPLSGISGTLSLIDQRQLDKEQQNLLNAAQTASNHLIQLVNLILTNSKIEAGKIKLSSAPFNIYDLIDELDRMFRSTIDQEKLELRFITDTRLSDGYIGDEVRLRQIMVNLIDNAIKFTPKGHVHVEINCIKKWTAHDEIQFSVTDTGVGIHQDRINKVLEAYEQDDLSTTRAYGGTGLGLTISNDLVKLMGSKMQIVSDLGVGTRFEFNVLLERINEPGDEVAALSPALKDQYRKPEVLIVEDNKLNQMVLEKGLTNCGYRTSVVNNGKEAVDAFSKKHFPVVIMDLHMPVMDGFMATKVLKNATNLNRDAFKIIALTASVMEDDKQKAFNCGVDFFLTKPATIPRLDEMIMNICAQVELPLN